MFVCLFAVNAKTTARIDAKRSRITKNDPESVLCVHFYLSHFHFWLLRRRLTQRFRKMAPTVRHNICTTAPLHKIYITAIYICLQLYLYFLFLLTIAGSAHVCLRLLLVLCFAWLYYISSSAIVTVRHIGTVSSLRETAHLEQKCYC